MNMKREILIYEQQRPVLSFNKQASYQEATVCSHYRRTKVHDDSFQSERRMRRTWQKVGKSKQIHFLVTSRILHSHKSYH